MIVYVDVDGTLTQRQRGRSAFRDPPRDDVLRAVFRVIECGHEVAVWSGNTDYAKRVCDHYGIPAVAAMRKPDVIVDNQKRTLQRRLSRRVVLPEEFLELGNDFWMPEEVTKR